VIRGRFGRAKRKGADAPQRSIRATQQSNRLDPKSGNRHASACPTMAGEVLERLLKA